jgi:hypothetical protein
MFERAGLFELLQREYGGSQALYPGCNVHVTPSFYFPHVVYVDQHPDAQSFFLDFDGISRFIERNKHYQRSAYFRFICQDYTEPLPLPPASFDLLISLFAGGIARTCKGYLKPSGLLVSNNHHLDAHDAAGDDNYIFLTAIRYKSRKYQLIESELSSLFSSGKSKYETPRYLRQGHRGLEYNESDHYFVFRKVK